MYTGWAKSKHQNRFTRPRFARGSSASCEAQSCALIRTLVRIRLSLTRWNCRRNFLSIKTDSTSRNEDRSILSSFARWLTNAMEEARLRWREGGRAVNGQKPIRRRDRMSSVAVVREFRHVYLCIDGLSQTLFVYCYTRYDSYVFEPE